jgi:hypothetical protein
MGRSFMEPIHNQQRPSLPAAHTTAFIEDMPSEQVKRFDERKIV